MICCLFYFIFFNRIHGLVFWSYFQNQNFTPWEIYLSGGLLHCDLSNIRNRSVGLSTKTGCSFSRKFLHFSTYNPHAYCCPEKQSFLSVSLFVLGKKMHDSEPWLHTPHCLNSWIMKDSFSFCGSFKTQIYIHEPQYIMGLFNNSYLSITIILEKKRSYFNLILSRIQRKIP